MKLLKGLKKKGRKMKKGYKPLYIVTVIIGDEVHHITTNTDILKNNVRVKTVAMGYDSNVMSKDSAVERAKSQIDKQLKLEESLCTEDIPWMQDDIKDGDVIVGIYTTSNIGNRVRLCIARKLKLLASKVAGSCSSFEDKLNKLNKEGE